jgi:hypothetical protein
MFYSLFVFSVAREIGELSFRQVVLRVRLRKDAIAVALRDRVYVYHLADLSLRDKIYTADNPHGLLCLSTQIQDMVLACPSVTPGHVRVELYGLRKTVVRTVYDCDCGVAWIVTCELCNWHQSMKYRSVTAQIHAIMSSRLTLFCSFFVLLLLLFRCS